MRNIVVCLTTAWLLAGCLQLPQANRDTVPGYQREPVARDAAAAQAPRAATPADSKSTASTQLVSPVEGRKLVYTADFTIVVPEVAGAMDSALKLAREMGGYLGKQSGSTMMIRIPVDQFYETVERLKKLGSMTGNIAADDVTERYLDIETRLANAKALAARLRGLLEKANDLNESLVIERELARVQTEIDRYEGQLRLLANQTAFATISVAFHVEVRHLPAELRAKLPFAWLHGLGLERLLRFGGKMIY